MGRSETLKLILCCDYLDSDVGVQYKSPPDVLLWYVDYSELKETELAPQKLLYPRFSLQLPRIS